MAATETDQETQTPDEKTPLQIESQIDVKSACERHVVVTIPQAEVSRYRKNTYDEVMPKAELPGFRAGKAPRKLVESKFKDQVTEQVKSSLVMDSLQQVTEGDHFSAISEPNFDYEAIEVPEDGDFRYEFTIEVRPDFETPKWQGLSLNRPACELTDKHVDAHLARTLVRFMPAEAVDDAIEAGDTLTLNGIVKLDGKEISRFEEEEAPVRAKLSFGDAVLEGFDKLVIGKSEGDKVTATVVLGESAAKEELRGKEVNIEFEIVEAKRISVEEISAETLENFGFDDIGELRAFVRTELERQFEYHQQKALREQIVDELTKGADWEMPESLIRRQTNRELQRMSLELQRSGFSQDQMKAYLNASRLNARESTIRALREHFILEKIAEELEIEPSPDDYDKEIELIAEQSDSSPRRVRARLEKSGQMDAIRNQIIERAVIEKISSEGKITDKEDKDFLKDTTSDTADIDFSIAGEYLDIPEAKHDNDPKNVPGAPKLPEADKKDAAE